jgi:hypothetical protein
MEATTAAVEAPATTKSTAVEAVSAHAASVSTATTSVTATTTAATSECRSWLSQANRCQCEQGYSHFPNMLPPLDEVTPKDRTVSQRDLFGGRTTLAVNSP